MKTRHSYEDILVTVVRKTIAAYTKKQPRPIDTKHQINWLLKQVAHTDPGGFHRDKFPVLDTILTRLNTVHTHPMYFVISFTAVSIG